MRQSELLLFVVGYIPPRGRSCSPCTDTDVSHGPEVQLVCTELVVIGIVLVTVTMTTRTDSRWTVTKVQWPHSVNVDFVFVFLSDTHLEIKLRKLLFCLLCNFRIFSNVL